MGNIEGQELSKMCRFTHSANICLILFYARPMRIDRDISMKIPDIARDLMSERELWSKTKKTCK